jgi:DNA-binding MarR family transcriptional regulator
MTSSEMNKQIDYSLALNDPKSFRRIQPKTTFEKKKMIVLKYLQKPKISLTDLAKEYNLSRPTLYNIIKEFEAAPAKFLVDIAPNIPNEGN